MSEETEGKPDEPVEAVDSVTIEKAEDLGKESKEIDAEFVRQVRVQTSNIRTHLWLTESGRSRASASSSRGGRVPECRRCSPDGAALGSVALRQRYHMPTLIRAASASPYGDDPWLRKVPTPRTGASGAERS